MLPAIDQPSACSKTSCYTDQVSDSAGATELRHDLNAFNGTQTPEQGAAIAIRLATLPDDGPTGGLFDDTGIVPW